MCEKSLSPVGVVASNPPTVRDSGARPVVDTVVYRSRVSNRRAAAGFCGARNPRGVGSGTEPREGDRKLEKLVSEGVADNGRGPVVLEMVRARGVSLALWPITGDSTLY